jgi:hypothetical protein
MRLTFLLIYIIFASGLCIYVFRRHEINYIHIFDMDYKKKVSEYHLWTAAMILFFLWTIAFTFNLVQIYSI